MPDATLSAVIELRDQMSGSLRNIQKEMRRLESTSGKTNGSLRSMEGRMRGGGSAAGAMGGSLMKMGLQAAAAYISFQALTRGVSSFIAASDRYVGINARLNLIKDSQETVAQLNNKIYKSAQNARASYEDMASSVGKLGITAGDAFKNNDEIIKFSELMQKSFAVGGASAGEQSAAMYQLTQAMAAGKLQGDEFRSISENAPLLATAIAKEMGVTRGELKKMGAEGLITSDIIKNAVFNSANETNKMFKSMPVTFEQTTQKIKNKLNQGMRPAFQAFSDLLNSDGLKKGAEKTFKNIRKSVMWLTNEFKWLGPAGKGAMRIFEDAKPMLKEMGETLLPLLKSALHLISISLRALWDLFEYAWPAIKKTLEIAWAGIKPMLLLMKSTFDAIALSIEKVCNWYETLKGIMNGNMTNGGGEGVGGGAGGFRPNALGTNYFRGGLSLVGERGPELVNLPRGSQVTTASTTKRQLSGGGNVFHFNFNGSNLTPDDVVNKVMPKIKLAIANMA